MITEDYVSFETAKLLKEKGFNEKCISTYNLVTGIFEVEEVYQDWTTKWKAYISAPTLQMAMKWLREVHNYHICLCLDSYVEPFNNEYYILIRRNKDNFEEISPLKQVFFKTYEEAAEAAIKYCLENLM